MFIINCPFCGERDQSEFSAGGEAHIIRPKQPTELSDDEWADFLFMRKNIKGIQFERWNHGLFRKSKIYLSIFLFFLKSLTISSS